MKFISIASIALLSFLLTPFLTLAAPPPLDLDVTVTIYSTDLQVINEVEPGQEIYLTLTFTKFNQLPIHPRLLRNRQVILGYRLLGDITYSERVVLDMQDHGNLSKSYHTIAYTVPDELNGGDFQFAGYVNIQGILEKKNTSIAEYTITYTDPTDMDDDLDGYTENQGDCDDTDTGISPVAEEICGDGIDQDCDGSDLTCEPEEITLANGYWEGTLTENFFITTEIALFAFNGHIFGMEINNGAFIYYGTYSIENSTMYADITEVDDSLLLSNQPVISITATIDQQNLISGTFSSTDGSSGTVSMSFTEGDIFLSPSSLSLLEGSWTFSDLDMALEVEGSGAFSGDINLLSGCSFWGNFSLLNSEVNIYDLDMTLSGCYDLSGSYSGFATLDETYTASDTLYIFMANDTYVLPLVFFRE